MNNFDTKLSDRNGHTIRLGDWVETSDGDRYYVSYQLGAVYGDTGDYYRLLFLLGGDIDQDVLKTKTSKYDHWFIDCVIVEEPE